MENARRAACAIIRRKPYTEKLFDHVQEAAMRGHFEVTASYEGAEFPDGLDELSRFWKYLDWAGFNPHLDSRGDGFPVRITVYW